MKKGRHRRFEEARALKRTTETIVEPCPECGADPEDEHASWCLAGEDDEAVDGHAVDGLALDGHAVDEHAVDEHAVDELGADG